MVEAKLIPIPISQPRKEEEMMVLVIENACHLSCKMLSLTKKYYARLARGACNVWLEKPFRTKWAEMPTLIARIVQ